mmetsp:Transcript_2961/g.4510  ORF Transcript_2961/g.4510 Transcript_2961/m.4510 type:complete len:113 (-) Transcript_2961:1354-1692(-)
MAQNRFLPPRVTPTVTWIPLTTPVPSPSSDDRQAAPFLFFVRNFPESTRKWPMPALRSIAFSLVLPPQVRFVWSGGEVVVVVVVVRLVVDSQLGRGGMLVARGGVVVRGNRS